MRSMKYRLLAAALSFLPSSYSVADGVGTEPMKTMDLEDTLKHICSSDTVKAEIKKVIDADLDQDQRYNQIIDRRMKLRHEIAKDAFDRSIIIADRLMPLLSIGPDIRNSAYASEELISLNLPANCNYLAANDPVFGQSYSDRVQNYLELQSHQRKVHPVSFRKGLTW